MATPKEQHDARANARMIGPTHRRARPADATPPGGVPAAASDAEQHERAIREPAVNEPRLDEPPAVRERRPSIGDPPRG